ncbi:hypothetical protein [Paenibacillus spongiae]|uniref:Uncharacterized protein n=1 Tax=Paenibacillus spongiae TaxID=2909671 RepID=A0ABY5S8P9_9BACL|nr:hypothetical protein [Paenibacillus spongiae]UVI30271.1 hypothetical protein L1F29_33735 [Paenibacillus spongiae]
MSLIRTLSLDEMRFGDYDNVPVNSTRPINKKADFSKCLGTESSACRADDENKNPIRTSTKEHAAAASFSNIRNQLKQSRSL